MAPRVTPAKGKAKTPAKSPTKPKSEQKASGASTGGDGRIVQPNDNVKAAYEQEQATLLSIVHQIMAAQRAEAAQKAIFDDEVAKLKVPYQKAKDRTLELFRLGKAAKFERQWLEAYIADMLKDTREREDDRKREVRHRGMLNIGAQGDLFGDETPLEVKDEAYWKSEGYFAYQRGDVLKAPAVCPQRFVQAFSQGFHDGQAATIWAMKKAEGPPAAPETAAPLGDDEDEKVEKSPAELKAEEKRVRESLESMGDTMLDAIAEAEPELVAQVREDHEDDGLEASAEELAAQAGRPTHDEIEEAV